MSGLWEWTLSFRAPRTPHEYDVSAVLPQESDKGDLDGDALSRATQF
jgi:hypothetical protein